jgi:peptide/nickel transport system permease protein
MSGTAPASAARRPPGLARRLLRRPAALAGLAILAFWLLVAFAWPLLVPYGPTDFQLLAKLKPPTSAHWLGTDQFGRDVLSRLLAGSRSVIAVATSAALLGVALGTALGLVAAYAGGWIEEGLMRLLDALMAFPLIVVALLVIALVGPSKLNVVLVVALAFAPYNARVIRAAALAERDRDYVAAARMRGEGGAYIMVAEILPNILGTVTVELTVRLALAIFTVATLSFLGLGIQPPTPDWGLMIAEGRQFYRLAPWMVLCPALAIASLVIAINLVAEGLRR